MALRIQWTILCTLILMMLSGCASQIGGSYHLSKEGSTPDPLDGSAFGLSAEDRAAEVELISVNDDMREFLDLHVPPGLSDQQKVQRILKGILADGLQLSYDNFKTLTAEEAFYARQGNCMSFTNLFVAMARESGIDVHYQEVEVPPTWAAKGETWFDNRHINAIVNLPTSQHVVDFNLAAYDVDFHSWKLDDQAALARYHNNMGVHWMSEGDYPQAFLNFREALLLRPGIGYFWTNLGTLHRRQGEYAAAEAAYLRAIAESNDPAAMSNLSRLYVQVGEQELAEQYASQVRLFRRKNPYYLYYLAEQAYADSDYEEAEHLLNMAILRNGHEHEFFRLLGLSQLSRGDAQQAKKSFLKAAEIAEGEDLENYNRKLDVLAANAGPRN